MSSAHLSPCSISARTAPLRRWVGMAACILSTAAILTARPNVLFIAIDDLRTETGAYGGEAITPNMDRLAERGVLFRNAFAQQAVCAASRASLLTGLRPETTTVDFPYNDYFKNEILPKHPALPTYFHQHGYYTVAFGKIHHGHPLDLLHLSEHFGGDDRDESLPHYYGRWGTEENRARIDAIRAGSITDKMPMTEAAEVDDDAYHDGRNTTSAIRTLDRAVESGQPFFLAVGYSAPHSPFTAPEKYWDLYDPAALSLDEVRDQSLDMREANFLTDADETTFYEVPGIRADGSVPLETARHLRHGYLASVSYMDAQIGRLLDALDAYGVADETLVVLWSDHGFHLGERAHWGKRTLYDLDVRAPLIVAGPGVTSGGVANGLVEFIDIFPTLCEWAELEKPDYLEGESFADLLREPDAPGKDAVYFRAPRPAPLPSGQAVRTATHTYAEWIDPQGQTVLRQLIAHGGDGSMEITTLHPGEKSPLIESLAQRLRPAPPLHGK